MNAIEKIGGVIFVLDEDDSEKYITTYRAEHNLNQYRIVVDNTTSMPFYDLFLEYKDGKRHLHNHLFSTGQKEKLSDWIGRNIA